MILVLLSTPTCAFIPKYHCWPFFVWCISGSRCCSRFLVEVGACKMVASTIVPLVIRTPLASRCRFTCPRICSPSWCSSSKCRNPHAVGGSDLPRGHRAPSRGDAPDCIAPAESLSECGRRSSAPSALADGLVQSSSPRSSGCLNAATEAPPRRSENPPHKDQEAAV